MAAESEILTQIRTALAQHLKKDVSRVQPDHKLREDLGLDSLSTLELLFKLEEAFDMEIPNEDLPRMSTVESVAQYIEERLAAGEGHVPAAPGALAALASKAVATAAPAGAPRPASPPPGKESPARATGPGKAAEPKPVGGPARAKAATPARTALRSGKAATKKRATAAAKPRARHRA